MSSHRNRNHKQGPARPGRLRQFSGAAYGETVWAVELVNRADGRPEGMLVIGATTGASYGWHPTVPSVLADASAALFETSVSVPSGADSKAAPANRAH